MIETILVSIAVALPTSLLTQIALDVIKRNARRDNE